MDPEHLPTLIEQLLDGLDCVPDVVFISCTNFKAIDKLEALEQRYSCYVMSSNQDMACTFLINLT